jgi:DHA1 family bicyclomycin/chloramphenicol resistance-like MFS transporter
MPEIREHFGVDMGSVQLTLSLAMLGGAIGQLFHGPLSDRFGRRPVLLGGLAIYVVASCFCLISSSIGELVAARFFQGFGSMAAPVLARAMVRDLHERDQVARMLALMGIVNGLGPILAPIIGGVLLAWFDWRASFVFITVYGLVLTGLVWGFLGESVRQTDPEALRPARMARTAGLLLGNRVFVGYMLVNCFLFGGLGAYLSGVSFVVLRVLEVPTQYFGVVFGAIMTGNITGYILSARIVKRLGPEGVLQLGVGGVAVAGVLLAGFAWAGVYHVATLVMPMMLYMFCVAQTGPQAIAGALTPFPRAAGTASSLMGFFQSFTSAAVGMGVALAFDGTPRAMASFVGLMGVSTLLVYLLVVRRIPDEERRRVHG